MQWMYLSAVCALLTAQLLRLGLPTQLAVAAGIKYEPGGVNAAVT